MIILKRYTYLVQYNGPGDLCSLPEYKIILLKYKCMYK